MKCFTNDHCGGLVTVPQDHQDDIRDVITSVEIRPDRGAAPDFRDAFNMGLQSRGWSTKTSLSTGSKISISSMKGTTGLCMQTGGNMSRMYADLLKLQHLYVTGKIACGVMIVPTKPTAKLLGDNLVDGTRLVRELTLFSRVIHIPMIICSFE
jgi:hypothetical protein